MMRRMSQDWPPQAPPPPWQQAPPPPSWPPPPPPQAPPAWQQPQPWQQGPPAYPYPGPPPQRTGTDGFAITSLIFGILPCLGGLLGVIFGFVALSRIKRRGGGGHGMAITGIVFGFLWMLAIAGLAVTGALNPTRDSGGRVKTKTFVTLSEVRVGDCVAEKPPGEVSGLTVKPCVQPHLAEVYYVTTMHDASYPGDQAVDDFAVARCRQQLPIYVDATPDHTGYDIYYVQPTRTSWAGGNRVVVCMLRKQSGQLTGSAKGAGPAPS